MKSKIIKVSIILIFMMFSACLFNFCFAYTATDVVTYDCIIGINTYKLSVGKLTGFESMKIEIGDIDETLYNNYLQYGNLYFLRDGKLYCAIPRNKINRFLC